jgi:hypothetical protein
MTTQQPNRRVTLLALLLSVGVAESQVEATSVKATDLLGTWDVALHYAPDKPPSKTEMVVTGVAGGKLQGTFYGTEFSESGVTVFAGQVIFTAVTADGTGPYIHSGRLAGRCIEGQTLSVGRDFLMAWTACLAQSTP